MLLTMLSLQPGFVQLTCGDPQSPIDLRADLILLDQVQDMAVFALKLEALFANAIDGQGIRARMGSELSDHVARDVGVDAAMFVVKQL